jgi:subfamily B ATP-binding cassette protein MsbA
MIEIISKKHKGSELILRLWREHLWRYRLRLALAVFCMILVASTTATNAWMMQPALDQIFIKRSHEMLFVIPFAVLIVTSIGALGNYGNTLSMRYIGQRIIADMQTRLFTHLMQSDVGLFHAQASGRLISRFTNDIALLRNAFTTVLTALAKESLSLMFLVVVMFYQNVELALIALIVFPVAIYPLIRLGKRMRRISDSTQNEMGEFTATLDEIFSGVRTVKSYNREQFEITRAKSIIETLFGLYYKAARTQAKAAPMMEILSGISIASVI